MSRTSRRSFLKRTLAGAASIAIGGTKSTGRVLGANETIRIAIAGVRTRGKEHIGQFAGMKGVEIAYLIDPDTRLFDAQLKLIESRKAPRPKTIQDFRQALEDKTVDAISIATPNHWHTLMTILSCQAGKDVYVEKPCSHNIHEGRVIVDAARKYDRIVQHGTQNRSDPKFANVIEIIKSGKLGKLLVARGLCYKPRRSIGIKEPSKCPAEVDFNLWLGPAREQSFHENLVHYNWHWFWDFGNGDIGNQGVHQLDVARWGIEGATLPKHVMSLGGRFGYTDQGETPNTQMAVFDYGETQMIFEVRGLTTEPLMKETIGTIFHLTEGTISGNDKFYPKGSDKAEPLPKIDVKLKLGPGGHSPFSNFIAAVRSRKITDLNSDVLEGRYSSALCHLANISYRLGKKEPFDPRTKAFGDNKEAYETLARLEEHLSVGNALKLEGLQYQLGRKLTIDAATETFVDDADANKMLTREYRKPFVVPEKIS